MPRLPGRESTQKTVELDEAVCHSFLMPYEIGGDKHDKQPCCITGCHHRFRECESPGTAAYVGYEDRLDVVVGLACPCCVSQILDPEPPV